MSCPARLGAFAAVSLVLLRLATGWHFFQEGTNKLNDPSWSSAGFLMQAKGPLADFYHSKVPQSHNWQELLAIPREAGFIDPERIEDLRKWQEAYDQEIQAAREAGEPEPFKISEYKPYARWADQIIADWQDTLEQFFELPEVSDEEKEQASAALDSARQQLVSYLDGVEPEISEYQHELFRIDQMEKQGTTGNLAYFDERIRTKESEAARMAQPWLTEVAAIEEEYHDSLRAIYRTAQERREAKADAAAADAAAEAEAADEVADTENAEPANAANQEPAANEEAGDNVAPEAAAGNENEPQEPLEGLPPSPEAETSTSPSSEGSADAASDAAAEEEPPPPGAGAGAAADAVEQSGAEADADSQEPADDVPAGEAPEEEPLTIQQVLTDSKQAELALVDKVVTWSHVIIGACLVVGLFTPIAALGGAVFLAMVISTQPPWVPGTQDTYYQFVEMFGLLVLAATCAGRWAGLDYFFACLFGKCRRS